VGKRGEEKEDLGLRKISLEKEKVRGISFAFN
jgi:hypothetical protein